MGVADDPGREGPDDLHLAAFQKLEQALGVFLFLAGGFGEDVRDLDEAVLLGAGAEIVVAVAGLRFTGEGGEDVAFGLGAFQGLHDCSLCCRFVPGGKGR